ncbi:hypothetical protein [Mesorhizobium ciceri]|uniref:hypothetical protein n=1 Tax=Mesorhizobium TaxID=68287 RepID=UPI0004B17F0A|nr:hypothetical protein [Mesorhizobium ciceri]
MGRLGAVTAAMMMFAAAGEASAQCAREGEELCQGGQTYRCEKTGSELTPIFQNLPCAVNVPSLSGTWLGNGHQSPAGDTGADWAIAMTINDGSASIDYPSLGCGGSLSQMSRDDISAQSTRASPTVRTSASMAATSPSDFTREICPGPGSATPTASPTMRSQC